MQITLTVLAITCVVWSVYKTPLAKHPTRYIPFQAQEVLFGDIRWQVVLQHCLSCYITLFKLLLDMYTFQDVSKQKFLWFPQGFSNVVTASCPPRISSVTLQSHLLAHLILLSQFPRCLYDTIYIPSHTILYYNPFFGRSLLPCLLIAS